MKYLTSNKLVSKFFLPIIAKNTHDTQKRNKQTNKILNTMKYKQ